MRQMTALWRWPRVQMLAAAIFLSLAGSSWAATGEVSGFGGALSMNGGIGTHGLYGARGGIRFGGSVLVFGEGSWSQLYSTTQQSSSGGVTATATGAAKLAHYGGGIEYGLGSSKRFSPFVLTARALVTFTPAPLGRQIPVTSPSTCPFPLQTWFITDWAVVCEFTAGSIGVLCPRSATSTTVTHSIPRMQLHIQVASSGSLAVAELRNSFTCGHRPVATRRCPIFV